MGKRRKWFMAANGDSDPIGPPTQDGPATEYPSRTGVYPADQSVAERVAQIEAELRQSEQDGRRWWQS